MAIVFVLVRFGEGERYCVVEGRKGDMPESFAGEADKMLSLKPS